MSRRDMAIIGGGLAGAAFAIALARAGCKVTLVERMAGPHDKVCGEFLSGEALTYLEEIGVDAFALGAVPIDAVVLSRDSHLALQSLPFRAASLSRRRLDEALLARAGESGTEILRGSAVRRLRRTAAQWTLQLDDGRRLAATHAALATGKHDLRGFARPPGRQNDLIGLKSHFRLTPSARAELGRSVRLGLFPGGYVGLEPVEDGLANLCLLVRSATYAGLGRDWRALLAHIGDAAPDLGALLVGAEATRDQPLATARIPYGLVRREQDGLWRLGDQAAVIPSFAGEGMSIALHSASLAARNFLRGGTAGAFQNELADGLAAQVRLATRLSQGLVRARPQAAAAAIASLFPRMLSIVAAATRIAPAALVQDAA